MRTVLILAATLVACAHPQPAPTPAAPQPDCAAAVEGGMRIVGNHVSSDDQRERAKGAMALRCVEDKWSAEATACIAKVTEPDAAHKCLHDYATPAQRDALFAAIARVIDKPAIETADTTAPANKAQAELAEKLDADGQQALLAGKYTDASAKFRQAAARVPDPKYFFNLCVSLFQEGKFDEALTACHAGKVNYPPAALAAKIEKLEQKIVAEAKAQGITLSPYGR